VVVVEKALGPMGCENAEGAEGAFEAKAEVFDAKADVAEEPALGLVCAVGNVLNAEVVGGAKPRGFPNRENADGAVSGVCPDADCCCPNMPDEEVLVGGGAPELNADGCGPANAAKPVPVLEAGAAVAAAPNGEGLPNAGCPKAEVDGWLG